LWSEMKGKHVLALVALVLGVVGGVLLCVSVLDVVPRVLEGRAHVGVESVVVVGVGVVAIVASVIVWKGSYLAGGLVNIVLGVIAIYYGKGSEGIIVLISGVLGVVAPQVKD